MKDYTILTLILKTGKYYRCSSGIMKYLKCKETNTTLVFAPTEEEFLQGVNKFFR